MTDQDIIEIDALKRKYGVEDFRMEGNAEFFRHIYLVEAKGDLPPPQPVSIMLDSGELAYFFIPTTWCQMRVQSSGYAGASVGLPTGIKGVRLRLGQYDRIRRDHFTTLGNGTLYSTTKRLIFHGDSRSMSIDYSNIIDLHIHSDCLKIDKSSGASDYFLMNAAQARYFTALIGALR